MEKKKREFRKEPVPVGSRGSRTAGNVFDAFVKKIFGRILVFADFLRRYADAKFMSQIDLDRIRPAPTHYIGAKGDERIADLVFQCPLKNGTGTLAAVIVFEHQGGSLKHVARKLLKYVSAIWEAEIRSGKKILSVPYFIVLRTGKKPHRGTYPGISDLFPKFFADNDLEEPIVVRYDVVDLPAWDFDQLTGEPVLRSAMQMLKLMTEGAEGEFSRALLPIIEIADETQQVEITKELLDFVAKVMSARDRRLKAEEVSKALKPVFRERETIMIKTIFDEMFLEGKAEGWAEGVEKGRLEGKAEGKAEGKIETIFLFLADRLGGVSQRLEKKIQKITDLEKLDRLVQLSARCKTLKEFEQGLD